MSKRNSNIWIERDLLQSTVFIKLKGEVAVKVLFWFMARRQMEKCSRRGRTDEWRQKNNGEIVFTYREAEKKFGIKSGRFKRAISELIAKGFIDIAKQGGGVHRHTTLYSISNRWREYGTDKFKKVKIHKQSPVGGGGFKKGNKLGRNCKKK